MILYENWDTPTYSNPNLNNIKQVHKELQKTYVICYHIISFHFYTSPPKKQIATEQF